MADDTTNWKFNPDAGNSEEPKASIQPITWAASEYIDHKQGPLWFVALVAVTAVVAGLVYLITKDYIGAGIVVTLGLTVGIFAKRTPQQLTYQLTPDGLMIGEKMYPFGIFKTFSIIEDGALISIDLLPIKRYMPPVSVYFDPADEDKIVSILEQYLPYEERRLDGVERLTRRLRF